MEPSVRHVPERSRFELLVDGRLVGVAEYVRTGNEVVMHHTEVEPRLRATGLGSELVGRALDELGASGYRVVPACSFVARFIRAHPQYEELVA